VSVVAVQVVVFTGAVVIVVVHRSRRSDSGRSNRADIVVAPVVVTVPAAILVIL
jgi:hypothetical protein